VLNSLLEISDVVCLHCFVVVAEFAVELDVEDIKRLSSTTLSEKKNDAEKYICDSYLPENAKLQSNLQLIAFTKFNQRFSSLFMSSSGEELMRLVKCYLHGELKMALEVTLNRIVPGIRIKRIDWSVKDFDRCNKYFAKEQMCNSSTPISSFSSQSLLDFSKVTIGIL